MSTQDPRQFLKEYLSLPVTSPATVVYEPSPPLPANSWLGNSEGRRWRAHGYGARAETVQFLKHHVLPRLQLHLVTFENTAGEQLDTMLHIAEDEDGFWHMLGGAGSPRPSLRKASPSFPGCM